MALAEAIKIAVRVRPFDEKETKARQRICIEMVSLSNACVTNEHSHEGAL